MKKIRIIAWNDIKYSLFKRNYLLLLFLGPAFASLVLFLAVRFTLQSDKRQDVLVIDKYGILGDVMGEHIPEKMTFTFDTTHVDPEVFATSKHYRKYEYLLLIEGDIIKSNTAPLYFKDLPSVETEEIVRRLLQKRIEQFKSMQLDLLSYQEFKTLSTPITLLSQDAISKTFGSLNRKKIIVGSFLGSVCILLILIFSGDLAGSILSSKMNNTLELELSAVTPKAYLKAKILSTSALTAIQLFIWLILLSIGYFIIKSIYVVDIYDPTVQAQNLAVTQKSNLFLENDSLIKLLFLETNYSRLIPYLTIILFAGLYFYSNVFMFISLKSKNFTAYKKWILPIVIPVAITTVYCFMLSIWPNYILLNYLQYVPFVSPIALVTNISLSSFSIFTFLGALGIMIGSGYLLFLYNGYSFSKKTYEYL